MAADWDLFIDEYKDGGKLLGIGAICLEAGVTPNLGQSLVKTKDKVQNSIGHKISEIHWTAMDHDRSEVALEWVNLFLSGPLMFHTRLDITSTKDSVGTLVRRLVQILEANPKVKHGLVRGQTTVHLDYDSANTNAVLSRLRRSFGLLRAFQWHSRGSELIQLSDLLLGISVAETSKALPPGHKPQSKKQSFKVKVMEHIRNKAKHHAKNQKRNAIVVFSGGSESWLF